MKICVYGASSQSIDKKYIEAGERLGELMAERGHTLVFGGGANGLMGAVARGEARKGGEIIGVAPSFFNVDGILFENCTDFVYTETMRERKQKMEELSDAFIMTPGGIGTFEEFFEILTLRQLSRHKKPIAVLNTNGYYNALCELLDGAIAGGFMTEQNRELFFISDSECAVLDYLEGYKPTEQSVDNYKNIKN